jgi:hypothetical protein
MFSAGRFVMARKASPVVVLQSLYSNCVTALLNGNGTNGQTNLAIIDSSATNIAITKYGAPAQGSFSPYGTSWSNFFNGTTDYLTVPSNANIAPGAGDFTIECWVYRTAVGVAHTIVENWSTNATGFFLAINASNVVRFFRNGGDILVSTATVLANVWTHIAVTRSAGTAYLFINGVLDKSAADNNTYTPALTYIGWDTATGYFKGYLSNLRIVKGSAAYVSAFTPSAIPLAAITGTALLTCQSNSFKDNSSNSLVLTAVGTPKVVKSSPFQTNTYDPAVDGGSVQFGTPDALTYYNANLALATADFSIETWFYLNNAVAGDITLLDTNGQGARSNFTPTRFGVVMGNTYIYIVQYEYGTAHNFPVAVKSFEWNHIAVCRFGGLLRLFLNGVQYYTEANSENFRCDANSPVTGFDGYNRSAGTRTYYLSDYRIVKGVSAYSANFTPPASPLTAIANTQFLLKGTNAGITDSTKCQDWQSYGNAQITTANKKYGTGSIKLDTGGYLQTAITVPPQINMGASPTWTMEMWVCRTGTPLQAGNINVGIGDYTPANNSVWWSFGVNQTNQIGFYNNISNLLGTTVLALNTWYHVACVCNAGVTSLFVNGVKEGNSGVLTTAITTTTGFLTIGQYYNNASPILIDDLRITNGVARYSQNFTPVVNPNLALDTLSAYNVLQVNAETTISPLDSGVVFNGTTDKLSFNSTDAGFNFGNQNWTIECWINPTNISGAFRGIICIGTNNNPNASLDLEINNQGYLQCNATNAGSGWPYQCTPSVSPALNQWSHVAVTRSGTNMYLFLNGVLLATSTVLGTNVIYYPASAQVNIGYSAGNGYFAGAISNLRVVKGTALYTATFTPPARSLTAVAGTSLLTCVSDISDGSSNVYVLAKTGTPQFAPSLGSVLDSSANALALTKTGTPSQGSFSPYNPNWSVNLNGSYAVIGAAGTDWFGSGDFSIETYFNATNLSTCTLIAKWYLNVGWFVYISGGSTIGMNVINGPGTETTVISSALTPYSTGQWNKLKITLVGTTYSLYYNDILITTATTALRPGLTGGQQLYLGIREGKDIPFVGYLASTKIYKAATLMLDTCRSNRFIDNSSNNFAVVPTASNIQVVPQSPFAKVDYVPAVHGGSIFFPASGSFLSRTNVANNFDLSAQFTVELFAYMVSTTAQALYAAGQGAPYGNCFDISWQSNKFVFSIGNGGNGFVANITSTNSFQINAWHHIAVTRDSSNVIRLFVNGVQEATVTASGNGPINCTAVLNGRNDNNGLGNSGGNCYTSNARYIKGTAVYTANFAVPTSPLTAVANTQQLLNGTNAALVDQSMSNTLTVLGTAQVSTSQFKYGASSMYFPGGTGNYISIPDSTAVRPGTSDFTIECWVYRNVANVQQIFVDKWLANVGFQFYVTAANVLRWQYNLSGLVTVTTIPATTWTHVAVSRAVGTTRLYINGVESASVADATDYSNTTLLKIGTDGTSHFNGYLDDFRLTIGKSRPVFAVPTEQLT